MIEIPSMLDLEDFKTSFLVVLMEFLYDKNNSAIDRALAEFPNWYRENYPEGIEDEGFWG